MAYGRSRKNSRNSNQKRRAPRKSSSSSKKSGKESQKGQSFISNFATRLKNLSKPILIGIITGAVGRKSGLFDKPETNESVPRKPWVRPVTGDGELGTRFNVRPNKRKAEFIYGDNKLQRVGGGIADYFM